VWVFRVAAMAPAEWAWAMVQTWVPRMTWRAPAVWVKEELEPDAPGGDDLARSCDAVGD